MLRNESAQNRKIKMYGGYASMPALRGPSIGFQISSTGEGIVTVHRSQGQGSFITVNEKYRNI